MTATTCPFRPGWLPTGPGPSEPGTPLTPGGRAGGESFEGPGEGGGGTGHDGRGGGQDGGDEDVCAFDTPDFFALSAQYVS